MPQTDQPVSSTPVTSALLSDADVGLAPVAPGAALHLPSGGGGVSFDDAVGKSSAGWTDAEFGLPAPSSAAASPSSPGARPLTVRGSTPVKPANDGGVSFEEAVGAPHTASKLMSDADVGLPPASSGWSDEEFGLPPRNADTAAARGLGPLANTQDDSWSSGGLKGAATAAIKGASHVVGQFGDVNDLARFLAAGAASWFDDRPAAAIYADMKAKEDAFNARTSAWEHPVSLLPTSADVAAPILKKTGEYQPTSEIGKLASAGVEAAAGGLGPGAGAAMEGAAGRAALAATVRQAPLNAVAGIAGQGAIDATGNPYVGLGASLLAPSGAEAAGHGLGKVTGSFAEDLPVVGKAFAGTRDARVGQSLINASSDPAAVKTSLGLGPDAPPAQTAIPGSTPTLGQLTGDTGLLGAERQLAREPGAPIIQRETDQNSARKDALAAIAPAGADTMRPSEFLTQQLAHIDQASDLAHQRILSGAQQLAAGLGSGQAPEVNGAAVRTALQDARSTASDLRSDLYNSADPDGTLAASAAPIRSAAASVVKGLDPYDAPMSADEARLFGQAQSMPDVLPYRSLVAFDKAINNVLPEASGVTKYRLGQLKTSVMGALNGTADATHDVHSAAVDAGAMQPSETVMSRLQSAAPVAPSTSAYTPAGRRIDVQHGLADLSDLITSHGPDGSPNPAFPQDLQPRDRSRAASQTQIADIASNLQPERLGASPSTADGAPVVGPDGVVESGNGRVLALQRAYNQNGPAAASYRDFLTSQGFDTSGMDRPVMVRQRTTALSPDERAAFTRESNAPTASTMSAPERAASDAGRMSDATLSGYQGGDVISAENRPFVRSFMGSVPDAGERGALAAGDGTLSMEGAQRVKNAMLHAGYGDPSLVSSLVETGDPDIAAFGRSLQDNAGGMAQLRRGVASGDVHAGADLSGPAVEAARVVQRARSTGQPIHNVVDQADAFNPISEDAKAVLRAGYGNDYAGRLNRGRLSAILGDAVDEARQQTAGARLFGEPLTARDVLDGAVTRYGNGNGRAGARSSGVESPGQGNGASGDQGRGSGPRSVGPGGSGQGQAGSGNILGPKLVPNLDDAAANRLNAAKQAHRDLVTTYDQGPVGQVLKTNGYAGQYDVPSSGVMSRAFVVGDRGYETARAFLQAAKNNPAAVAALADHAMNPLRSSLTPEATVSPKGYADWRQKYAGALRAIDEVRPGFSDRFGSAAQATDVLSRAGAARQAAIDGAQKGAAGQFIGKTSPVEVENQIGAMLSATKNGPTAMRDLVARVSADPDALAGLRKAAVGWMSRNFVNTSEAGTSGEKSIAAAKFQRFVQNQEPTLSVLFPEAHVNTMRAIAADLERSNRDITGTRIRGAAQDRHRDISAVLPKALTGHVGHSALALGLVEGLQQAFEHGGLHGVALAAAPLATVYGLNKLRSAGLSKEQAMFSDALMNPDRARIYLSKVKPHDPTSAKMLANAVRREMIATPVVQGSLDQQRREKAGRFSDGGAVMAFPTSSETTDAYRLAHLAAAGRYRKAI